MATGKEIAQRPDTLPGLVPEEADNVADQLYGQLREEGGQWVLSVLPTAAQRVALKERKEWLAKAIRPISGAMVDKEKAAQALGRLFAGYPNLRNANAAEMIATYIAHLEDLPLYAIEAACRDAVGGRIMDRDSRTGRETPIDPDFAPTSPRLHEVAARHAEKYRAAHHRTCKVLEVRVATAPVDEKMRARVAERMRSLAEEMRGRAEVRKQEETEFAAKQRDGNRAMVMRDYKASKMKPVYAGDIMISASLVKQIQERNGGKRAK